MKKLFFLFVMMFCCALHTLNAQDNSIIMTVTGPVMADEMDTTLTHEHILVDFIGADSTGYHRWDRRAVIEKGIALASRAAGNSGRIPISLPLSSLRSKRTASPLMKSNSCWSSIRSRRLAFG